MTSQTCKAASPKRIFNNSMIRICNQPRNTASHLFDCIVVLDGQQPSRKQDLQLLDDDLARIIDADECADDVARFTGAEL